MEDYKKTPLWDSRLSVEERLDYLLEEMTMEEKLEFLGTTTPKLQRLGLEAHHIGGEAAHGIEARHDQDGRGIAEPTTSFPQPIGMSATWDPELLQRAGEAVGKEARVLYQRHPDGGLFRWAPTVDMERDPRWGRTEEGYGEDPYLTGKMASAYVRGMQGPDPEHLLISSALKHFFANNVEDGRAWKSSSIDARNRYEYYYEPFRRAIEEGKATSLMTAYNAVNGVTGMLDHRVNELIRGKWGLNGHVVCDGGAMSLVANVRHETASHGETIAKSLKAGVDCMTDQPGLVKEGVKEAVEKGWITKEDIDRAIRHSFATKLRLGMYDAWDSNPWNHVPESELNSEENQQISLKTAEESIVLLKNDGLLPLKPDTALGLIGPLADQWFQDWYGGEPPYRTSVSDGIRTVTGAKPAAERGLDRVLLRCKGGYLAVDAAGVLTVTQTREEAEVICIQDWDENSITLYIPRLKRYLSVHDDGTIAADKKIPYGWFVKECFHWSGRRLETWYGAGLCLQEDGRITPEKTVKESGIGVPQTERPKEEEAISVHKTLIDFETEVLTDGIKQAVELAQRCDVVVLTLGCCPMINGKEDADRKSIRFPPAQRALAQAVYEANPNTVLVLLANYPYGIDWESRHLPAILLSATGGQDMGTAIANTLFGQNGPAGRLNMTWYPEDEKLPDMDAYDIMKTGRTYRYYTGKALYPFGHGLTYSTFSYDKLRVYEEGDVLKVSLTVANTGSRISDEVVQLYAAAPKGRAKKPIRQLIGFCRLHDLRPGQEKELLFEISRDELRYYDVVRGDFMVEQGTYLIEAGASSGDIRLQQKIFLRGEKTGRRRKGSFIRADHWDDYSNVILTKGPEAPEDAESCSACADREQIPARICYRDCEGLRTGCRLYLRLSAKEQGGVLVSVGERTAAKWDGRTEGFEEIPLVCGNIAAGDGDQLSITLKGDVHVAGFWIE